MAWFKVDDAFYFHEKTIMAGNEAVGLWVRAGTWSAATLTDGRIPDHIVAAFASLEVADRLVNARMWRREEGAYQFHEWSPWQPTRAEVLAAREKEAARKRDARERQKGGGKPATAAAAGGSPVLDTLGVDVTAVRQAIEREFDIAPNDHQIIRLVAHILTSAPGDIANKTGYVLTAIANPQDYAKWQQVMKG